MAVMPRSTAHMREMRRRELLFGSTATRPLPEYLKTTARAAALAAGVSTAFAGVTPMTGPQTQFSSDPNSIVTVQVQTIIAPTPNTYQQTGALCSAGGTTLTAQNTAQLTQYSDLSVILVQPIAISTAVWATGTVTVTLSSAIVPSQTTGTLNVNITGFSPASYNYNGPATVTSATQFTYPIAANPGSVTTYGTMQPQAAIELSQMVATFFAQGNLVTVWVLELGGGTLTQFQAALQTWLNANPRSFYGYLLPRMCGATTANVNIMKPLYQQYQGPMAMTYFWTTVSLTTLTSLGATFKSVIQFIEAPSVTSATGINIATVQGEFSMAAMFYNAMSFFVSNINPVAPMAFKYLYGVTGYPTQNNGPTLTSFKTSFTNYVATGAEGGIAYNIVYQGVTLDGNDYFNWWWTIDWVQINVNLNLSNAIINGSNNALAPLYYNQNGINYLETVLYQTMQSAATFGMVLGKLVMTGYDGPTLANAINQGDFAGECNVNAVPFLAYTLANPGAYKTGEYDGLSTLFIPARGFIHILVLITASSLISV